MQRPQFSLLTLAGLVAFVAIACAALVYASAFWSSTLFTSVIAWLMVAMLAAIHRQGRARAFLVGSAVFGWTYLLLIFWPTSDRQQFAAWYKMDLGSELATSHLAHWAYEHVLPLVRKPPPKTGGGGGFGGGSGQNFFFPQFAGGGPGGGGFSARQFPGAATTTANYPDEETFIRVAHGIWAWLIALLGGVLGRFFFRTRPPRIDCNARSAE